MVNVADKIEEIIESAKPKNENGEDLPERKKGGVSQIEILMDWLFDNYDFRINGYTQQVEFKAKVGKNEEFRELTDIQLNTMRISALTEGFSKTMATNIEIVIKSEYVEIYYGIKDYFDKLERLTPATDWYAPTIRQYFDTLTLQEPDKKEMLYNLFLRYIVACVNSSLQIKHNDVMLLLVGAQGKFKTSWLNNLAPKSLSKDFLFTGHIQPTLTDQNTANYLAEKMFINIDDQLEVIFGKDYNSMKAIISIAQITNRKVFARSSQTRPRIANFIGSVNSREFLNDHENRRYLVIEVTDISPAYTKVDMDRFWAEAYAIAQNISPYNVFTKNEYKTITQIAQSYTQTTVEESLLFQKFSPEFFPEYPVEVFMQTSEILEYLQHSTTRNLSLQRLSNALKRNKFKNKSKRLKRLNNTTRYGWVLFTFAGNTYFDNYTL